MDLYEAIKNATWTKCPWPLEKIIVDLSIRQFLCDKDHPHAILQPGHIVTVSDYNGSAREIQLEKTYLRFESKLVYANELPGYKNLITRRTGNAIGYFGRVTPECIEDINAYYNGVLPNLKFKYHNGLFKGKIVPLEELSPKEGIIVKFDISQILS